jgi:hypothetical protein
VAGVWQPEGERKQSFPKGDFLLAWRRARGERALLKRGLSGAGNQSTRETREITPYAQPAKFLSRLRRFDRITLASKGLGGLESLFPAHPPRDRAPAGIVVEGEPPRERTAF